MKLKIFWRESRSAKKAVKALICFYGIIVLMVAGLVIGQHSFSLNRQVLPAFSNASSLVEGNSLTQKIVSIIHFDTQLMKKIIASAIPMMDIGEKSEKKDTRKLIDEAVYAMTKVDLNDPTTYIKDQIPMLANIDINAVNAELQKNSPDEFAENEDVVEPPLISDISDSDSDKTNNSSDAVVDLNLPQNAEEVWLPRPWGKGLTDEVLVAIYHTHSSECFYPTTGHTHLSGQNGDIVNVGEALKIFLEEEHGIRTYQSKQIHDYPLHREAYGKSIHTAKALVDKYPNLKLLVDVHRDAQKEREITVANIAGQDVAKVLIIVGSNKSGLEHPNWQQNYQLALKINEEMEKMYPGLSRGVQVSPNRFNQHFSENSLLFEVGSHLNTREEAIRTAKLLADVIASAISKEE
jgi:stage II sporulation protein P